MPAPLNNVNAAKTGTKLVRLTVGELPTKLNHVKIEGRRYRRALEAAVTDVHGEISVTDAHAIDTATAATIHAGICRWLLRQKLPTMAAADVLACSRELLKAKETRDRAVRLLRLDVNRRDAIDALYSDPSPAKPSLASSDATQRDRSIPRTNYTKRPSAGTFCNRENDDESD
jgi:hypothetical protein